MRLLFLLLLVPLLCPSCSADGSTDYADLDLTAYNIPVTIRAPDSARVVSGSLSGLMDDITVKSAADRYAVQILASAASTNDMTRMKAEQLELVRENRYFEKIVSEDPAGFVFENRIDTTSLYGFRYIVYRGDREIVFQNSFDGVYQLDEIQRMYDSIKPAK